MTNRRNGLVLVVVGGAEEGTNSWRDEAGVAGFTRVSRYVPTWTPCAAATRASALAISALCLDDESCISSSSPPSLPPDGSTPNTAPAAMG
eukprot:CAMPEP_0173078850 /NCGR_PEP_ID=MMETSP1102-20130122/14557_1 /TAXON_ID=49646 /ORGANISM="Geminigera sp., Strain Caron Lab Isolate" /LENGTH=90 /DNA_ID=CAMNT_0013950587 /DNA_START=256 /DNA_END=528 /DNA_ORIENTATION=+